jgi:hypothetical protein
MEYDSSCYRLAYFFKEQLYYFGDYYYLSSGNTAFELHDLPGIISPGMKIFTFHPIHLYLNTGNIAQYDNTKKDSADKSRLTGHRNPEKGVFTFFMNVIDYMKENQVQSKTLYDIYQEVTQDHE